MHCKCNSWCIGIRADQEETNDPFCPFPTLYLLQGAMIRDGVKSVNQLGACKETTWPYVITKFKKKPTKTAYTEALKYQSKVYSSVGQDMNSVRACLAAVSYTHLTLPT